MYGRIYRPLGSTPAPTILMPGATGLTAYNAVIAALGYPATGDTLSGGGALNYESAVTTLLANASLITGKLEAIGYPNSTSSPALTAAQHTYLRTLYGFLKHLQSTGARPSGGAPAISKPLADATVSYFGAGVARINLTQLPSYIDLLQKLTPTATAPTAITPADNAGGSGIADTRPEDEGQGAKETPDFGTGSGTGTNTGDTNRRNPDGTLAVTTQPGERDALARKQAEDKVVEEKKKRRRLYIIGGGIIAAGAAVALVVSMSKPSPKYKPVAALSGVRKKKNKAKKPKPFKL
jgi:hypothetical protein